jgi:radical SAM superfamily enzyme YgiQ (UPF0313 family)
MTDVTHVASTLLISCYELGHRPLGLAVPGGVLHRAGIPVTYNDISVEKLKEEAAASACLIGISVPMHTALRLGVAVARRVRALNPDAHICFYGLYAQLNADYLTATVADSCLGAECEAELLDLARRITGRPRGVTSRSVTARNARSRRGSRELDLTPRRASLLENPHYVQVDDGTARRSVGSTVATRGCKHTCRHCPVTPVYGGHFYAVPVERVLDDIAVMVQAGVTHVTFADPDFLNGRTHALRVARGLRERFPGVTFDYTAKIEHLAAHPEVVEALYECGALFVVSALESFNDDVLRHLDKGHTRADALAVIRHFRRIGHTLRPTLVPFTPWETLESLLGLFDTVAAEGLIDHIDPVQLSLRLLVPPGSPLVDSAAMAPYLGALDGPNFSYHWTHPDTRMDDLQRRLAGVAATAARDGVDAHVDTFLAMLREALEAAGRNAALAPPATAKRRTTPVPGLTEAWFC